MNCLSHFPRVKTALLPNFSSSSSAFTPENLAIMFTLPDDYHTTKIKCSHCLRLASTSSLNTSNSKTPCFVFAITDFLFSKISLYEKSFRLRCWVYRAEIGADMATKRLIFLPLRRTLPLSNSYFHISLDHVFRHTWLVLVSPPIIVEVGGSNRRANKKLTVLW